MSATLTPAPPAGAAYRTARQPHLLRRIIRHPAVVTLDAVLVATFIAAVAITTLETRNPWAWIAFGGDVALAVVFIAAPVLFGRDVIRPLLSMASGLIVVALLVCPWMPGAAWRVLHHQDERQAWEQARDLGPCVVLQQNGTEDPTRQEVC